MLSEHDESFIVDFLKLHCSEITELSFLGGIAFTSEMIRNICYAERLTSLDIRMVDNDFSTEDLLYVLTHAKHLTSIVLNDVELINHNMVTLFTTVPTNLTSITIVADGSLTTDDMNLIAKYIPSLKTFTRVIGETATTEMTY